MNFFNKIKIKYRDTKFRNKTFIAFFSVSLIPLTILGGFCFAQARYLLINRTKNNIGTNVKQIILSLDNQLEMYNKMLNNLSFEQEIINTVNMNYRSEYEMYEQYNTIDDRFRTNMNVVSGIKRITLYTKANIPKHGNTVIPIEEIENEEWYRNTMGSYTIEWHAEGNELLCAKKIRILKMPDLEDSILIISIDKKNFFSSLQPLIDKNMNVVITDNMPVD